MLAEANDWTREERAAQLATSMKGSALEILGQLSKEERYCYKNLVAALQRRYSTSHQKQVFRAKFRTRVRTQEDALQMPTQDPEGMAN